LTEESHDTGKVRDHPDDSARRDGRLRASTEDLDAKALADWATPVAGLNIRPGHFSEEEYYRAPVDNLRTYPVYYPGREPEGYWEMLQKVGPKPLIEPETLKTEADWIRAGKRVFEEYDIPAFRTYGLR